jgi:hypothetical protein
MPSVINKRQSPFWFTCTVNYSLPPHLSMAPNSCQPFTPWAEAFFPATSAVNSIFRSNNIWYWYEKHDFTLNFNVAELSQQRSVFGSASGEYKRGCSNFRSYENLPYQFEHQNTVVSRRTKPGLKNRAGIEFQCSKALSTEISLWSYQWGIQEGMQ